MAAVASSSDDGAQSPIALWNNSNASTDDVIEHAIQADPDLADIASRLDSAVTLDADRDLNLDMDSSDTASEHQGKDSDSISTTSSSHREGADNSGSGQGSPDGGRRRGSEVTGSEVKDNSEPTSQSDSPIKSSSPSPSPSSSSSSATATSQHANGSSSKSSASSSKTKAPSSTSSTSSKGRKGSVDSTLSKSSQSSSKEKNGGDDKSGKKNPLQLLKRLTKFDKSSSSSSSSSSKRASVDYNSEFSAVVIDKLPQVFVVKYLGHRQVSGVCGLHHVRRPVDEMVKAVKEKLDSNAEVELPLLYVVVSPKGLDLREHKRNKVSDVAPLGVMPIDFISYGVQDIKYWRVFTCIVVRELSSRSRSATCHAFLCDSSHNGRKMALALGASFNVYAKKLKTAGKTHNFQVELRPPDQLADAVDAEFDA